MAEDGKGAAPRPAYGRAGVDVAAGDRAVALMAAHVASTRRPEVVGGIGGFGAAVAIPAGYREPLLVSSTDGVGTKTAIASRLGRYDTIGRDLVAAIADDVVCSGARPLFLLDYIAVGRLDPTIVAELVGGVAAGCRDAGCALVGGETAEHPGLMAADTFDLAGCCVGVVERDELIDGRSAAEGDVIVGLAASGLHANGFSLVRSVVDAHGLDLRASYRETLERVLGDDATDATLAADVALGIATDVAVTSAVQDTGIPAVRAERTLGDVLLTPTTIYSAAILDLGDALAGFGGLRGVAHITGGGLPGNAPRAVPTGLGVRLDPSRWPMPSAMRLIGRLGGLDEPELRATFNGGLGMIAIVAPTAARAAIASLARSGIGSWVVGEVVAGASLDGVRYVEGPLG
ncbi:MAG: phosphoribosylformylglycinamidine cyclo-ligase [Chloroflexi bacterium]|nr:phosphoribosylformylglycinamidine cyclo-ligase [Chloroflexota bacterium]